MACYKAMIFLLICGLGLGCGYIIDRSTKIIILAVINNTVSTEVSIRQ